MTQASMLYWLTPVCCWAALSWPLVPLKLAAVLLSPLIPPGLPRVTLLLRVPRAPWPLLSAAVLPLSSPRRQ